MHSVTTWHADTLGTHPHSHTHVHPWILNTARKHATYGKRPPMAHINGVTKPCHKCTRNSRANFTNFHAALTFSVIEHTTHTSIKRWCTGISLQLEGSEGWMRNMLGLCNNVDFRHWWWGRVVSCVVGGCAPNRCSCCQRGAWKGTNTAQQRMKSECMRWNNANICSCRACVSCFVGVPERCGGWLVVGSGTDMRARTPVMLWSTHTASTDDLG